MHAGDLIPTIDQLPQIPPRALGKHHVRGGVQPQGGERSVAPGQCPQGTSLGDPGGQRRGQTAKGQRQESGAMDRRSALPTSSKTGKPGALAGTEETIRWGPH